MTETAMHPGNRFNNVHGLPEPQGLYHPSNEHDACGLGLIANIKGVKSHQIVQDGLKILLHLEHGVRLAPIRLLATGRAFSFRFRTNSSLQKQSALDSSCRSPAAMPLARSSCRRTPRCARAARRS